MTSDFRFMQLNGFIGGVVFYIAAFVFVLTVHAAFKTPLSFIISCAACFLLFSVTLIIESSVSGNSERIVEETRVNQLAIMRHAQVAQQGRFDEAAFVECAEYAREAYSVHLKNNSSFQKLMDRDNVFYSVINFAPLCLVVCAAWFVRGHFIELMASWI